MAYGSVMPYRFSAFGISDIGLRNNNEDAWELLTDLGFFILADGMGGHKAGEVAAQKAIECLSDLVRKVIGRNKANLSLVEAAAFVRRAIEQVNSAVYKLGRANVTLRGMGTTLCCLYLHEEGVVYGHVGDSRIYCLRQGTLKRLTQDHSLLRDLVDLGQLSEEEAKGFLYKNIITRAIGTDPEVEPSVHTMDIQGDDYFLLCSDGLSDVLSDSLIELIMRACPDPQKCAEQLVEEAKNRGAQDNITVILIKELPS